MLAEALAGDADALTTVAGWSRARIDPHRLAPALAARLPDERAPWRREVLGAAAARWLFLQEELTQVGRVLEQAGVGWVPIKGVDLATRVYEREEDRPTSDLDLLIAPEDLPASRHALTAAGWNDLTESPLGERYLREEGYAWQAQRPRGPLVELHFRLWGFLPAGADAVLAEGAHPDPTLPPGGSRPTLATAYALAALHHWATPAPRALIGWWDLATIADRADETLARQVAAHAVRLGVELPILLAAAQAEALWPHASHRALFDQLVPRLRRAERAVLRRARRHGSDQVPLAAIVLARLLARRPSRAGWRSITRRVWGHPGVVAQETPASWTWPRRRLVHAARGLGLARRG